ncbi:MAG: VOC family protein [Marmoricola sp.]
MTFDLDHTSFAVADALTYAKRLRRDFGAVPIVGEVLSEFRYLLLYAGTVEHGARVELLEPTGPGFLTRFLEAFGEGPHHITITVPDLVEAVVGARDLGLKVVGESYDHPGWREAFVMPDSVHGTVIQMASSLHTYPSPAQLLSTRERDMTTMPAVLGATDPFWWESAWETEPDGQTAWLGATHLVSSDPQLSRDLFGAVLGGEIEEEDDGFRVIWPSGAIHLRAGEPVGIERVERHGRGADWAIGRCAVSQ